MSDEPRDAFLGLRHFKPEVIRNFRCALDLGIAPHRIKRRVTRTCPAESAPRICAALDYMIAHPRAGVITWIGGTQYDWAEREVP